MKKCRIEYFFFIFFISLCLSLLYKIEIHRFCFHHQTTCDCFDCMYALERSVQVHCLLYATSIKSTRAREKKEKILNIFKNEVLLIFIRALCSSLDHSRFGQTYSSLLYISSDYHHNIIKQDSLIFTIHIVKKYFLIVKFFPFFSFQTFWCLMVEFSRSPSRWRWHLH